MVFELRMAATPNAHPCKRASRLGGLLLLLLLLRHHHHGQHVGINRHLCARLAGDFCRSCRCCRLPGCSWADEHVVVRWGLVQALPQSLHRSIGRESARGSSWWASWGPSCSWCCRCTVYALRGAKRRGRSRRTLGWRESDSIRLSETIDNSSAILINRRRCSCGSSVGSFGLDPLVWSPASAFI